MSGIRLERVFKNFPGSVAAVNNLSIEVFKKELLLLAGPSGCGKSTLLRLIAGLEEPSSGNVYIDDQLVNYIDPSERNIAIVYQNLNLNPHVSIAANLEFGLKFKKLNGKYIKERIKNISETLDITDLLKKFPSDLDIVEKQRVAFARAAVKLPRVFLVDRVSTDYGEHVNNKLFEEIEIIQKKLQVTTVLAVDCDAVPVRIGDRIAVMNNGRIEQAGIYDELYNNPVNNYVAGFMGKEVLYT